MPRPATFAEWLSAEADKLKHYFVTAHERQLTHCTIKPECVAVTDHITVCIATAALSDRSDRGWFYDEHGYVAVLLIVELSKNAPAEDSCQLVQNCFVVNREIAHCIDCSIVQTPPQITLHPGDVGEYLSDPLLVGMGTVFEG